MAYFANSSEDVLTQQCYDCPLGAGWSNPNQKRLFGDERPLRPCPVALVQLQYNYDQIDIPKLRAAMTVLVSDQGECEVRKLLQSVRRDGVESGE